MQVLLLGRDSCYYTIPLLTIGTFYAIIAYHLLKRLNYPFCINFKFLIRHLSNLSTKSTAAMSSPVFKAQNVSRRQVAKMVLVKINI